MTSSGAFLRLVDDPVPGLARVPRAVLWWLAAGLQALTLLGGGLWQAWPAGPTPEAIDRAARSDRTRPAFAFQGPPAPRRLASTGGRVTPYPPASVQVLLSAGDRAQLAGHPRQALGFYDQILRENPGDPRAPEAAFTAGSLLLHALGRPGQAAQRFAQARRLAPHGPMAEDALAQEIASWVRAGKPARARARVEEFRALFPGAPLPEWEDAQGG